MGSSFRNRTPGTDYTDYANIPTLSGLIHRFTKEKMRKEKAGSAQLNRLDSRGNRVGQAEGWTSTEIPTVTSR